uniref:Uncharacterized protein n=1 Tax=Panagrolaimus davidi TaxID=227884 RepID=A0A914QU03_9BILA
MHNISQCVHAKNDKDTQRIAFNDHEPAKEVFRRGKKQWRKRGKKKKKGKLNSNNSHMKGIIIFRNGRGILITHSCPQFPALDPTEFSEIAVRKAQHIICINIDEKILEQLIQHLYNAHPHIYDMHVPNEYLKLDKMEKVKNNIFYDGDDSEVDELESYPSFEMKTPGGLEFDLFSKCDTSLGEPELWKSLWDEIANLYDQKFDVQTWYRRDKDLCKNEKHLIRDVGMIKVKPKFAKKVDDKAEWSTNKDHSKYGFSKDGKIVIIADMNHTV